MNDHICFPKNPEEAMAMLYVQSQDLTGKSAADLYTMYLDARKEIAEDFKKKKASGYFSD